jgi:hypothetical protein
VPLRQSPRKPIPLFASANQSVRSFSFLGRLCWLLFALNRHHLLIHPRLGVYPQAEPHLSTSASYLNSPSPVPLESTKGYVTQFCPRSFFPTARKSLSSVCSRA